MSVELLARANACRRPLGEFNNILELSVFNFDIAEIPEGSLLSKILKILYIAMNDLVPFKEIFHRFFRKMRGRVRPRDSI
ncbi:hypothetical protein D3C87_1579850 [compost metagenome]